MEGEELMLNIDDLVIDKEFDELLPVLTLEEFERLEQSILKNGMLDPIKVWEEPGTGRYIIIDGHNRYRILKKHNIGLKYWEDYKIMYANELHNRDDVKHWMLEQQLGRRNLSEAERYEIVQKFKSVFEKKAKNNQSSGGKGLSNLSKVNTRKEMAKSVGVSEGTYQKMDKVMQSDNEELKQQLREKKVSVDKAYKEINKEKPVDKPKTYDEQINDVDNKLNQIEEEMKKLESMKKSLKEKRNILYEDAETKRELQYEFSSMRSVYRECRFFVEVNGKRTVFVETSVLFNEEPSYFEYEDMPEVYHKDFDTLWRKAHKEDIDNFKKYCEQKTNNTGFGSGCVTNKITNESDGDKVFYKKCYRILAKNLHPDNENGSIDDMKRLNKLKESWGI